MKKLLTAGLFALGSWAGAAQAATTITFDPTGAMAAGTQVYQNFDNLTPGSSIGTNASVFNTTMAGAAVQPTGSTGNYAAVLAGGSFSTAFSASSVFSFLLGSLDSYNNLTLRFADGTATQLVGTAITGGTALNSNGTVTYRVTSGPLLTGATFGTAGNSFEFDNLASAVPEPAAWGMMILGFGLVGGVLRRRAATAKVRFA